MVFREGTDVAFYANRLTVMGGAVVWDVTGDRNESKCIDLDPFTLYESSISVPNPLVEGC